MNMNVLYSSFRPQACATMALLLLTTAGNATSPITSTTGDPTDAQAATVVRSRLELRLKLEPDAPRLRCWQHGVSVLDERLSEATVAQSAALLSARSADGQQLVLLPAGAGLCLATMGKARLPATSAP